MSGMGLYNVPDYSQKAQSYLDSAGSIYSRMDKEKKSVQKTETEDRDKTVGGGVMSAGSGAAAGASIGSSVMAGTKMGASAGGLWGAAIGAGVGALGYMLS